MTSQLLSTSDLPPALLEPARLVGYTPSIASSKDPRVSYSLYIPARHYNPSPCAEHQACNSPDESRADDSVTPLPRLPIIVLVHGTTRQTTPMLELFKPLADHGRCALLAPLFPAGAQGPNDWDSYKTINSGGSGRNNESVPADVALLSIIDDDVALRWPGLITRQRVLLVGFSGGASFAQRFALKWPNRVRTVTIVAPGSLAQTADWTISSNNALNESSATNGLINWAGQRNASQNWILMVGTEDTALEGSLEGLAELSKGWKEMDKSIDWNREAKNKMHSRSQRLAEFRDELKRQGVRVKFIEVVGARHSLEQLAPHMVDVLGIVMHMVWKNIDILQVY